MYIQNYIDDYPKEEYLKYLNDPRLLQSLADGNINLKNNRHIDANKLAFKESLDHFVAKSLTENPKLIETKQFDNYIKYIWRVNQNRYYTLSNGNRHYPELVTNVVFSTKEIADKIYDRYFKGYKSDIQKIGISMENQITMLINKMKNKERLSSIELSIIGDLIRSGYRHTKKSEMLRKEFIKYILNLKDKSISPNFYIYSGILSCLPYEYNINAKYPLSDCRIFVADVDGDHTPSVAHSRGDADFCCFEKSFLEKSSLIGNASLKKARSHFNNGADLYGVLMVAFHELTHQFQRRNIKQHKYNNSSLSYVISSILNDYSNKHNVNGKIICEYHANHDMNEMEISADEIGWSQISKLCANYNIDISRTIFWNNMEEARVRRIIGLKKDENGRTYEMYIYDISNLERIMKEHPELLNTYPILRRFFKNNGTLDIRKIITMHHSNYDSSGELGAMDLMNFNNAALEFLLYCISNRTNEIKQLFMNNHLTEEEKNNFKENIKYFSRWYEYKRTGLEELKWENLDETRINWPLNKESIDNLKQEVYNHCLEQTVQNLALNIDIINYYKLSRDKRDYELSSTCWPAYFCFKQMRKYNIPILPRVQKTIIDKLGPRVLYKEMREMVDYCTQQKNYGGRTR